MENHDKKLEEICQKYKSLKLIGNNIIRGTIHIDKVVKDEHIIKDFKIEINFDNRIPTVKEIGNEIGDYKHKYKNGNLCLETDFIQLLYLDDHSYLEWLDYFVVNYLCSFVYYKKYNYYPYGERPHTFGMFHSFQEYIGLNQSSSLSLLNYVALKKYRGHDLCPCNSGLKVRNCHKNIILQLKSENILPEIKKILEYTIKEIADVKKNKYI